jgi:predicted molibdopterin-dependent oxidoreductase YjgC
VVLISIDGKPFDAEEGASVAAAVLMSGTTAFRHSVTGEPRAPLCGMGICFECRLTIDGVAHARSCQIEVREGMEIRTS